MYRVEFYAAVRRSVYVEGLSERAAARRFGLARETVRKMLRYRVWCEKAAEARSVLVESPK